MVKQNLVDWVAASMIPGVHGHLLPLILDVVPSLSELFRLNATECTQLGFNGSQVQAITNINRKAIDEALHFAQKENCHIVTIDDAVYPPLLREISDPPLLLYVMGDAALLQYHQIALIGARNASIYGERVAKMFGSALAEAGFVITSGLAYGIDSASHAAVLSVQGLTIAVFGTGLLNTYPKSNRILARNIVDQGGALVSELPLSAQPMAWHFPRRNRLISGLSQAVLVIEAALKSGSLVTAKHALSQNRDVFAVPGNILDERSKGCHVLLKQGAILVDGVEDMLSHLTEVSKIVPTAAPKLKQAKHHPELTAPMGEVLALLESECLPFDRLLTLSRLTMEELSSMLLTLELLGHVKSSAAGYLKVSPCSKF